MSAGKSRAATCVVGGTGLRIAKAVQIQDQVRNHAVWVRRAVHWILCVLQRQHFFDHAKEICCCGLVGNFGDRPSHERATLCLRSRISTWAVAWHPNYLSGLVWTSGGFQPPKEITQHNWGGGMGCRRHAICGNPMSTVQWT